MNMSVEFCVWHRGSEMCCKIYGEWDAHGNEEALASLAFNFFTCPTWSLRSRKQTTESADLNSMLLLPEVTRISRITMALS